MALFLSNILHLPLPSVCQQRRAYELTSVIAIRSSRFTRRVRDPLPITTLPPHAMNQCGIRCFRTSFSLFFHTFGIDSPSYLQRSRGTPTSTCLCVKETRIERGPTHFLCSTRDSNPARYGRVKAHLMPPHRPYAMSHHHIRICV